MISGLILMEIEALAFEESSNRVVAGFMSKKKRIPGIGHRLHKKDSRFKTIFDIAKSNNLARNGIKFLLAIEKVASEHFRYLPFNIDEALDAS